MKKYIVAVLALFSPNLLCAQTNTFPSSGNVGVGTLNPTAPVEISKPSFYGDETGALKIKSSVANQFMYFSYLDSFNSGAIQIIKPGVGVQNLLLNPQGGNIGIGTTVPAARLHVVNIPEDANGGALIIGQTNSANLRMGANNDYSWIQSHGSKPLRINEFGNNVLFNLGGGYMGIGTDNPREKLSVNGKIRAQEIKVETANWPDYVFDQDYKITGLQELESYIKANKHLPEMPSAKEVEANGVALGDLNKLLLKKVEELTLHLIEKDKALKRSIDKAEQLEANMNAVLNRLSAIERKINK